MNKNKKEFELSNIQPYIDAGITGKGWKFTTLESLGKSHGHAEMTIAVYKTGLPDAEFIECPIKTAWSDDNIDDVVDWAIENGIRTILISLLSSLTGEEIEKYNNAIKRGQEHGVFFANSIGNDSKDMTGKNNLATVSNNTIISAIYFHDGLNKIMRAGYSNYGEPVDYAEFSNIWLESLNKYGTGTSASSPFFNMKRDMIRIYVEKITNKKADYNMIMEIVNEHIIDLGEIGEDYYYGKGLLKLPNLDYYIQLEEEDEEMIRKLEELHPKVRIMTEELLYLCEKEGLDIMINETYRTQERQNELYAQGRTAPGNIITWTKHSKHTERRAVDFIPVDEDGNPDWNDHDTFDKVRKIATDLGFTILGDFDKAHIQYDGDITMSDWDIERSEARLYYMIKGMTDGSNPTGPLTREQYWVMKRREEND